MGTVKTELMNDGNVTLVDFGTFKILERSAHIPVTFQSAGFKI